MKDLGNGPGSYASALGIGADGTVVGYYSAVKDFPAIWRGGKMLRLPTLPSRTQGTAWQINESGQIAGQMDGPPGTGTIHAALWDNVNPVDLGTLPGGKESRGAGINAAGQVVGEGDVGGGVKHACVWTAGKPRDVHPPKAVQSWGAGINDQGDIVGMMEIDSMQTRHAFLYRGGAWTDLGGLPGKASSEAHGINKAGQVVGWCKDLGEDPKSRAFLWQGGKMFDLNSLVDMGSGWTLRDAVAINDRGQIAGTGAKDGKERAFLLTPK